MAESGFNPNPQSAAIPSQRLCFPSNQRCPGFSVSNVSLRVHSMVDINSQQVSFVVRANASKLMSRVDVYLDNVSLGAVEGPFVPGIPKAASLGVPTTITLAPGQSYRLVIRGVYLDSSGNVAVEYWQAIDVTAAGG